MNPDFGPGHLPTSASQGIESQYILAFWGRLTNDKRAILEQILRDLPITHFSCLEKVLEHCVTHVSSCGFFLGKQWILRDLSACSPGRLRAYLMILSTPGHDYAKPKPEKKYLVQAIGDKGSEDLDWKPHHCHVEDIEAKEAGEELARAREHAEWIDLQRAVQNLPLDLNLLIRDTMFKDIFGPGKEIIFPDEGPTYLQHFRALDRKLYEKYSSIYYCQNIWVIGKGSVGGLIETNEGATPTVLSKIKKVTLKWTWRDAMKSAPTRPFVQEYVESEMNKGGAERFDNLEVMEKFARICLDVEDELLRTWSYKSYELSALQLNNLVIDAREAFAPDGEFLGLAAAHRWEKSIRPPSHLHIWTPGDDNNNMAKQIFQIIAGKYSW